MKASGAIIMCFVAAIGLSACAAAQHPADGGYHCKTQDELSAKVIDAARAVDAAPTDQALANAFSHAAGMLVGHTRAHNDPLAMRTALKVEPTIRRMIGEAHGCVASRDLAEMAGDLGLGTLALDTFAGAARGCVTGADVASIRVLILDDASRSRRCPTLFALIHDVWPRAADQHDAMLDAVAECSDQNEQTLAANVSFADPTEVQSWLARKAARRAAGEARRQVEDAKDACEDRCMGQYGGGTTPCQASCSGSGNSDCVRWCEEQLKRCDAGCRR